MICHQCHNHNHEPDIDIDTSECESEARVGADMDMAIGIRDKRRARRGSVRRAKGPSDSTPQNEKSRRARGKYVVSAQSNSSSTVDVNEGAAALAP